MEAELAAGQPVTGLEKKEEAAVGKGRLFRDRASSMKVRPTALRACKICLLGSITGKKMCDLSESHLFKRLLVGYAMLRKSTYKFG